MADLIESASRPMQLQCEVRQQEQVARDTWKLRVHAPQVAEAILPGQFVMLKPSRRLDPLLARPYALWDTTDDGCIEIVYVIFGGGTRALSQLRPGELVDLWGPMGNTFPTDITGPIVIVAGGIGQTPFLAVLQEMLKGKKYGAGRQVRRPSWATMLYGARSAEYLNGFEDLADTDADVRLATDDGSAGYHGRVTDLLLAFLEEASTDRQPAAIFGCGPDPMLHALGKIVIAKQIPCWVSLETKMACGYGVCFSCVCPVIEPAESHNADSPGWDYRRVCLEGPVFRADQIAWNAM